MTVQFLIFTQNLTTTALLHICQFYVDQAVDAQCRAVSLRVVLREVLPVLPALGQPLDLAACPAGHGPGLLLGPPLWSW